MTRVIGSQTTLLWVDTWRGRQRFKLIILPLLHAILLSWSGRRDRRGHSRHHRCAKDRRHWRVLAAGSDLLGKPRCGMWRFEVTTVRIPSQSPPSVCRAAR